MQISFSSISLFIKQINKELYRKYLKLRIFLTKVLKQFAKFANITQRTRCIDCVCFVRIALVEFAELFDSINNEKSYFEKLRYITAFNLTKYDSSRRTLLRDFGY